MSIFSIASWFKRPFWLSETANYNGPSDTYSGKSVTVTTALALSTVWSCVRLISESIASLPCNVFSNDSYGDKVLARDNELYRILHKSPNADMTSFDFWQALIASRMLWGNAYCLKTFRGRGSDRKLVSIELLRPDLMSIKCHDDGRITYVYNDLYGQEEYTEDQIIHFKGFSLDGRIGLSTISYARNTFASSMAQEETSGKLFSNGMRPGGALTLPNVLKSEQREQIRASISEQVGGVSKTGGMIILEGGMTYTPLSIKPEDAQMLESRAFSVEEICRWFGVPPSLIGHTEKSTTWGTGIEQINLGFLTYTLQPIIKSIEQELKKSLFSAGSDLFAEFSVEGFLRSDSTGRAALYSSAAQNGWMSREEIRRKENLPYVKGSEALTVQAALVPLDLLGAKIQNEITPLDDTAKL